MRRPSLSITRFAVIFAVALTPLWWAYAQEQVTLDAGSQPEKSSSDEDGAADRSALQQRAQYIQSLLAGGLDVAIDPTSLFDVDISNERDVAIETRRLNAVLDAAHRSGMADAGLAPDAGVAPTDAGSAITDAANSSHWKARLKLDRARFDFYSLPAEKRLELLNKHRARQDEASVEAKKVVEAKRKEREAAEARQHALDAAKQAHTEAERRLNEEEARLHEVARKQGQEQAQILAYQSELEKAPEVRLAWERKVATLLDDPSSHSADVLYSSLLEDLHQARNKLAASLSSINKPLVAITAPGPSGLSELGAKYDTSSVDKLHATLKLAADKLRLEDAKLRQRSSQLYFAEVEGLNRCRLQLFQRLSPHKRSLLTGLNNEALAQAKRELRQVKLILHYQLVQVSHFFKGLSFRSYDRAKQLALTWLALKWLAVLFVFLWWYRRGKSILSGWHERLRTGKQRRRIVEAMVGYASRIHRPAEFLLFFFVFRTMLPPHWAGLLEVRLLGTVLIWVLGEAVVVDLIDAIFARQAFRARIVNKTGELRLRSLRLIGRTVVVFGLTASLSELLVGEGTIDHWVLTICWFAAIPVLLTIVHWYKDTIFDRIDLRKKHTRLTGWVIGHREGWGRLPAATLGGIYLFLRGSRRFAQSYLSGFDWVRRILAYWFRLKVSKRALEQTEQHHAEQPLSETQHAALSPDQSASDLVPSVSDEQLQSVIDNIVAPGGGVFAIVGERGSGKTTMMQRIENKSDATLLSCTASGTDGFLAALKQALGLELSDNIAAIQNAIGALGDNGAIVVDDAHRLIHPVIGGLDDFDEVLSLARQSSASCSWVFAIDRVIWKFLQRARGSKPLFDKVIQLRPWSEEGIVRLLKQRSRQAKLNPSFEDVIGQLPDDADELDHIDALARARINFYRLLWHYADGNPAIALHFWRDALKRDDSGHAYVRLFKAPESADLDALPDDAAFVLRAVVQLELATVHDINAATMLPDAKVRDTLRYARARGYVERTSEGHYCVRWHWYRAISDFLMRRHLLVKGTS